eukprot:1709975-Pleurochrysis_carterae.AAC.3
MQSSAPIKISCCAVHALSSWECMLKACSQRRVCLPAEVVVHPIALVRLVVRPLPAALAVAKQMAELALVLRRAHKSPPAAVSRSGRFAPARMLRARTCALE